MVASTAARTAPIRLLVLRPNDELRALGSAAGTWFAAQLDEQVVGSVGIMREEPTRALGPGSEQAAGRCWRLRGMAVDASLRGQGTGAKLVQTALEHATAQGGSLVWCHARTPAVNLYLRAGFRQVGGPWLDPVLGEHVLMWVPLGG